MGTYATTTSFTTLLMSDSFDTATTALLSKCITWSENEINRKLAKRYNVAAFATAVPPMVTTFCERLAMGFYFDNNSRGGKEFLARGKELRVSVRQELDELAVGKMELVDSAGALIAPRSGEGTGVLSSSVDYETTFAEDDPLTWGVDTDKLDDIADRRE